MTTRYEEECIATREILRLVGDKWSVMVIVNLAAGTLRFSDLKRAIVGISQRMAVHGNTHGFWSLEGANGATARIALAEIPLPSIARALLDRASV